MGLKEYEYKDLLMFKEFFNKNFSIVHSLEQTELGKISFKCMIDVMGSNIILKNIVTLGKKETISTMILENDEKINLTDYADHVDLLRNIKDCSFVTEIPTHFFTRINDLLLTVRTEKCLISSDLLFIGDLLINKDLSLKDNFLGDMPRTIVNFGKKSHKELVDQLDKIGIKKHVKFDKNLYYSMRKIYLSKNNT